MGGFVFQHLVCFCSQVSSVAKGEKTVTLPVENDFMDITRSHTVDASSGFSAKILTGSSDPSPKKVQSKSSDPSLCIREGSWSMNRSSTELGGDDPEGDVSMEMTEVQTGRIEGLSDSQDPLQFLISSREEVFPLSRSQDKADAASGQANIRGSSSSQGKAAAPPENVAADEMTATMVPLNDLRSSKSLPNKSANLPDVTGKVNLPQTQTHPSKVFGYKFRFKSKLWNPKVKRG